MAEKLRGTVQKRDLEGGVWELHTAAGETYPLLGGDKGLYVEGQKVSVTGSVARDMMGIGMTGPYFEVTRWSRD